MPIEITDVCNSTNRCEYCDSRASTVRIIVKFESERYQHHKSFCLNCAVRFINEQILPFFMLTRLQTASIAENKSGYSEDFIELLNEIKKFTDKTCRI